MIVSGHEYHVKMIDGVYRQLLQRGVDGPGGAFWGGMLDNGTPVEDVEAIIMGSDEYYARAGRTLNGFVNKMFHDVLNRTLDAGGSAYFVQLLRQGLSRRVIAGSITWSAEAIGIRVNSYYQMLLAHDADPSVRNFWVYLIGHGHRDQEIVGFLASSSEYLFRL